MQKAHLLSVATAVPEFEIDQDEASEVASRLYGQVIRPSMIHALFNNTGIKKRRSVRPLAWHLSPRPLEERNTVYLDEAERLWLVVAAEALERAGVAPAEVAAVVTVSSTGIATPSLEARAGPKLGLPANTLRIPVFGLGCAGGVTGLSIAARLAEARPGGVVLLVVVELCTLSARPDELTKTNVVASALFGDGAAAAVLLAPAADCATPGPRVGAVGEHTWPETLDIMGWRIDPSGLGVVLDRKLPAFVEQHFSEASEGFLAKAGSDGGPIDRFVCHPGGAKVIPALEVSLGLEVGRLDHERAVLADYGNMSAPTVLFVLERVQAEQTHARLVLAALGPGFTASFVELVS